MEPSREPGWIERRLGYLGTAKDNLALVGAGCLVFFGGICGIAILAQLSDSLSDWWASRVTTAWTDWSARSTNNDWMLIAKLMIGLALVGAINWVRDSIQDLRQANNKLVQELGELRVADRLKGLASAYRRLEIPVEDLLGTLKEFSLGMSEPAVHKLLKERGDFVTDAGDSLSYSVSVEDWQPGNWTAGLVIHGGLLDEVWLMGMDCPTGTRTKVEAELARRYGEPEPKVAIPESLPAQYRLLIEQMDRGTLSWSIAFPSTTVRARVFGDDKKVIIQARLL